MILISLRTMARKTTTTLHHLGRGIITLLLVALLAIVLTGVSPIYNFPKGEPFSGADIFNPYRNLDTCTKWKRANFHTHTRIDGIFNECDYSPAEVAEAYSRLGYDIVTFSNHNYITTHHNPELQVDLYEHGYNLVKYHKLVFGPRKGVMRFDHLLPILASQRQWQMDLLFAECDLLQLNHPLRTPFTTASMLQKLEGYTIMELDSGLSTENEYWDTALSAGHYSFGLAGDDLHYIDRTSKIARRCSFILLASTSYTDIREALLGGCYYSMRLPDYGNGDWTTKIERNKSLPSITAIGLEGNRIYAEFSAPAARIVVYGENHTTLREELQSSKIEYTLADDEPYARIVAHFEGGEVIYTNPFARYDSTTSDSPFRASAHSVNWVLTIFFNLTLGLIAIAIVAAIVRLWRAKQN